MDYIRTYKSVINSHHVSEGIKITCGVLLPALIMSYFNMLGTGILLSLGALFVSITDSPGPILHRKNGMVVCIAAILLVALLAGFARQSATLLACVLLLVCFVFSMLGVYGTRAGLIGTAAMVVLTLTIDPRHDFSSPIKIMQHALLISSGGLWYMCLSMLLYNFMPYRLAQQALGDCIEATAQYLLIRAKLYKTNADYESIYRQLLMQQAVVQNKQTELTELLFKTRSIVKDTTQTGRRLLMTHLDVTDIFERIMASYQQYNRLHEFFDDTGILEDLEKLAREMADELELLGIAVKSGTSSPPPGNLQKLVSAAMKKLEDLRHTHMHAGNIEGFINLRRILENLQDLADRMNVLHTYTFSDKDVTDKPLTDREYGAMISHNEITPAVFINNLSIHSDTFRHSLRVCFAVAVGYVVALLFTIGHSYWILLTIIVILKPAFSLTKKRNRDRLTGTIAGIIAGSLLLLLTQNAIALLAVLVVLMVGSFSFLRTNYFAMVFLMTTYLVLFYFMLNPADFKILLKDRIIDTAIGSAIAWVASTFLFPLWERDKLKPLVIIMVQEARDYFCVVANSFTNTAIGKHEQRLARKNAMVALANLSDTFTRMLSEPRNQQTNIEQVYQFVVLNHTLTSYIATLYHYLHVQSIKAIDIDFETVANEIQDYFLDSLECLTKGKKRESEGKDKKALRRLNEQANEMLEKRKNELQQGMLETSTRQSLTDLKSLVDQFNLIFNVAGDINKVVKQLNRNL